jgi:hypothetical protein
LRTDECIVDKETNTSGICNLWAGVGEDQNGQPEDCPYGTDAVCRIENGSGSAVGTNEYNFDCGAFAKKTGVTAYTQDTDKCTGFTVSAVLVHSGKCLSGVSHSSLLIHLHVSCF